MVSEKCRLFVLGALLASAAAGQAAVKVSVDRDAVNLNESLELTVETDIGTEEQPDFSALEQDFEVLSQSRSSNISILNGEYSAITTWSLQLMPKRTGVLKIPSLEIAGQRSEETTITVSPARNAGQDEDIFIEVELEPDHAYVQQQIIYTLKIFLAVNPLSLQLSPMNISGIDARTEQLGGDTEYGTTRSGKSYRVIERKFLIFPENSGEMRIAPLLLEARISRRATGAFGRSTVMRIRSDEVSLNIEPIPSAFSGKTWLPAKRVELRESWSKEPPVFEVGEPITRTLTLIGIGLAGSQLPELSPDMPADLKHYSDRPELADQKTRAGVVGSRIETYAIIPASEGEFALPAIEVPWWNTLADRLEIASLPARVVNVRAGAAISPAAPAPASREAPAPAATGDTSQAPAMDAPSMWPWVSLMLGLGWLVTLLLWWSRAWRRVRPPRVDHGPQRRAARTALKRACSANHAVHAKEALLQWARSVWPERPAASLGQIGDHSGEPLRGELAQLSRCLYGNSQASWRGEALWRTFQAYEKSERTKSTPTESPLEPLYRT